MGINSEQIHQIVTTDLCVSQYVNDTSKQNESVFPGQESIQSLLQVPAILRGGGWGVGLVLGCRPRKMAWRSRKRPKLGSRLN